MKKLLVLLPILFVSLLLAGCNVQESGQVEQNEVKETQNLIGVLDKGQITIYDTTTQELIKIISDEQNAKI